MLAVFLLGYLALAAFLCPVAVAFYRLADQVWLDRMTRTPWDDLA